MNIYQHTQPAPAIKFAAGCMLVICAIASIFIHAAISPAAFLIIIAVILGITVWIFRSLTVEVSDTELIWYFGPGWPRKNVLLSEVASVEVIRTTFLNGWGIHRTRCGWLYNVSGRGAVAITLKSGNQFCLGSDDPEKLAAKLRERQ